VAGLIAIRPGSRTRLCHRLRTHPAGKGKRRSMGARDFIALIDGIHQLVKAPIVLVWDRLNTHVSHAIRGLVTERAWLMVFLLPAYSPGLNPVEWVWAHIKHSLANLAVVALDRLEALVRNRLKRLQYRPDTLDGFIAGTGLTLDAPTSP
jgi:putative transposase